MSSLNRVVLLGNLTKDPELRHIPSGTAVCDMRLAVSESYRNKDGETVESTVFIDVAAWGRQAETCAQYMKKGSSILVEGRLQMDEWEKDGQKHSRIRVRADRVVFMDSRRDNEGGSSQQSAAAGNDRAAASPSAPF